MGIKATIQPHKPRRAVKKAIKLLSLAELGRKCDVSYQTFNGWIERNAMPDREYSGRTVHSAMIEYITDGQVTIEDLLGFVPEPQAKELERLQKGG